MALCPGRGSMARVRQLPCPFAVADCCSVVSVCSRVVARWQWRADSRCHQAETAISIVTAIAIATATSTASAATTDAWTADHDEEEEGGNNDDDDW